MIQQQVFVCGSGLLSHPVSFLFHLGDDVARGAPDKATLVSKRLVVGDCRSHAAAEVAGWVSAALAAEKPTLLLCPGVDVLAALEGKVGILPIGAIAALLIDASPNASGLVDFRVHALEYSAAPIGCGNVEQLSGVAQERGAAPRDDTPIACACGDFDALGRALVDPAAADRFKMIVERAMEPKRPSNGVTADTPPTGLKYFMQVFSTTTGFTYSGFGVSNGAGATTVTWTVWGFLSQTQQSNSQFLVAEGRISVSAGSLHANDQCDRGFANAYVKGSLKAPMNALSFVPSSGDGAFSGTVSIPISYKSPTGGYQIWTYTSSINNTVSDWACKSISSGASLGAQWWMTKPCDGSNLSDKWSDAFSFWGHVNDLTGASSGSLDVNSIAAWTTNSLLTGVQSVISDFGWQGARFWGSSCSPGMYWKMNGGWTWYSSSNQGFRVDFTPINP